MHNMRQRVVSFDAAAWAKAFVDDLLSRAPSVAALEAPMEQRVAEAQREIRDDIRGGRRVGLFLDYDGTLREFVKVPSEAAPTEEMISLFERLAQAGPNVDVTIISGRTPEDLEAWLSKYPFALIADHGASLRRRGETEWQRLDRNAGYGWKPEVLKVLELYTATTPGSRVEDKRTSLVFHYRQADPEFGTWKARHLATELAVLLANEPVEVRQGKMIIEVAAAQINKGAAVRHVLEEATYDCVLCAGDDTTDESMFSLDIKHFTTIKVGDSSTIATLRVKDPAAFRAFLDGILS